MNRKAGAIFRAGAFGSLLLLLSCSVLNKLNPHLDRDISGPVTITSEWLEITPREPLEPERQVQNVIIWFAAPHETKFPDALVFPDGAAVTPQVQVVDGQGNVFDLRVSGPGTTGFAYSCCEGVFDKELPKGRTYRTVRLRSERPIQASNIVWRCYNPSDRK